MMARAQKSMKITFLCNSLPVSGIGKLPLEAASECRNQSSSQQCRGIVFKVQSWTIWSNGKKGKISPRLRNPLKKTLMSVWKCAWYSLSAHLTSLCCLLPVILQSCSAEELVAAVFASILKRSASLNRFLEVQPMLYQIYRMEYAKTVKRVSLQPSVERCWWQDGLIYTKWILH